MTDQCKNCTFRGDLKACQAAECHKHDDWHSVQLNKRIAELEKEREALSAYQDIAEGLLHDEHYQYYIEACNAYDDKIKG